MPLNRPIPVVFFALDSEKEPVRDWLKALDKDSKRAIGEDIKTLQFGWPIGMPLARKIDDNLWELRSKLDKGIARPGSKIVYQGKDVGRLTSGTMVPYWKISGDGADRRLTDEKDQRAVGLALLDHRIGIGEIMQIEVRDKLPAAKVVKNNLDNRSGPVAFAVME